MKLSHSLSMTAAAVLLAASGFASASTIIDEQSGYYVGADATCTAYGLGSGASHSFVAYAGAGLALDLISPGALSSGQAGDSSVCVANNPAPASLAGSSPSFTCHTDTPTGSSFSLGLVTDYSNTKTPSKFTLPPVVGTTHGSISKTNNGAALVVDTMATLYNGLTAVCSFTTASIWVKK